MPRRAFSTTWFMSASLGNRPRSYTRAERNENPVIRRRSRHRGGTAFRQLARPRRCAFRAARLGRRPARPRRAVVRPRKRPFCAGQFCRAARRAPPRPAMSPGISAVDVALVAIAHQRPGRRRDGRGRWHGRSRARAPCRGRARPPAPAAAVVQATLGLRQIVARVSGATPARAPGPCQTLAKATPSGSPWAPIRMSGASPGRRRAEAEVGLAAPDREGAAATISPAAPGRRARPARARPSAPAPGS